MNRLPLPQYPPLHRSPRQLPPLQFRQPQLRYFTDLPRLNFDPLRLKLRPPRSDTELKCLPWYPPCPRCPPCPPCFAKAVPMDTARARMIEKKAFTVLKYSLLPARVMVVAIARRFKFQKRSQLFIGTHNEALSVAAMCVCNPDRSPRTESAVETQPKLQPASLRFLCSSTDSWPPCGAGLLASSPRRGGLAAASCALTSAAQQ